MRIAFGVVFIFFSFCLTGQITDTLSWYEMTLKKPNAQFAKGYPLAYPQFSFSKTYFLQTPSHDSYKVDHLPSMFCKIENMIQGKSRIAPRFRLGSLAYTEWMEGKLKTKN